MVIKSVAVALFIGVSLNANPVLFEAIARVESSCNDYAVGGAGELGRYQITKGYVDDVNRIYRTTFSYADRTNPEICQRMMTLYWNHYCRRYESLTGCAATDEVKARIHNGGPDGYKKKSTVNYWLKVKKEMENGQR